MLLAVYGKKGSGKTTLSDYVLQNYDYENVSFAKPLKEFVSNITGISMDILDGTDDQSRILKETMVDPVFGKTPRQLLQDIGVHMRAYLGDFWIRIAIGKINRILSTGKNVVVSDLRFKNEYDALVSLDCKVNIIRINSNNVDMSDTHISEMEMDTFEPNFIINNEYNLDFFNDIDYVITGISRIKIENL